MRAMTQSKALGFQMLRPTPFYRHRDTFLVVHRAYVRWRWPLLAASIRLTSYPRLPPPVPPIPFHG